MADPSIQELTFNVTDPNLPSIGPLKSVRNWRLDVKKDGSDIGSYVLYDITAVTGAGPVLRNNKVQTGTDSKGNPQYAWQTSVVDSYVSTYNNLSEASKKFLIETMASNADKKRADFINSSYNQKQKNDLFPNMSGVRNTAPPAPPAPTKPGGDDKSKPLGTTTVKLSISDSAKVRRKYGEDLCYPVDMKRTTQDRIRFAMLRYGSQQIEGASFKLGKRTFEGGLGSVILPIPQGITDDNGVEWGGQTLNPINAYLAGASLNIARSDDYGESLRNELGKAAEATKNIILKSGGGDAGKLYLAQEAVGIQGLLSRATGAIVNPNLELLFGGPTLRQFNFVFKLSARDQPEAAEIRKIIRFFKQGSSVKSGAADGLFLKAPNVFNIQYKTFNGEGKMINHPSLNRIKTCALLGCSVDYTPDGSYMTYNDPARTMTSYQLTLRFSELTPVIEDDYFDTKSDFEGGKLSTDETGTTDIGF